MKVMLINVELSCWNELRGKHTGERVRERGCFWLFLNDVGSAILLFFSSLKVCSKVHLPNMPSQSCVYSCQVVYCVNRLIKISAEMTLPVLTLPPPRLYLSSCPPSDFSPSDPHLLLWSKRKQTSTLSVRMQQKPFETQARMINADLIESMKRLLHLFSFWSSNINLEVTYLNYTKEDKFFFVHVCLQHWSFPQQQHHAKLSSAPCFSRKLSALQVFYPLLWNYITINMWRT